MPITTTVSVVFRGSHGTLFSWRCPAGVTQIANVECHGGGGRGSDSDGTTAGGGGGGGAYSFKETIAVTPGTDYLVGAGSGGGDNPDDPGGIGGTAYFEGDGGDKCLALGGDTGGNASLGGLGGLGGSSENGVGEFRFGGGSGETGIDETGGGGGGGAYSSGPGNSAVGTTGALGAGGEGFDWGGAGGDGNHPDRPLLGHAGELWGGGGGGGSTIQTSIGFPFPSNPHPIPFGTNRGSVGGSGFTSFQYATTAVVMVGQTLLWEPGRLLRRHGWGVV